MFSLENTPCLSLSMLWRHLRVPFACCSLPCLHHLSQAQSLYLSDVCMLPSTDIEQEANGLYSFDRKEKLDSVRVKAVMDEAAALYYGTLKSDQ